MSLALNFIIGVFVSLAVAFAFLKITGFSFWWGVAFLVCFGLLLYISNILLIRHYLKKNVPGVLELDELYDKPKRDEEYLWEKTAGTGVCPKWVSWIGIASYAVFASVIIWIIICLT